MTPPSLTWEDSAVGYTYDNLDRLRQATDTGHGHNAGFEYDAIGRVTKESNVWSHVDYDYDLAGNRTYVGYGDGSWVGYIYDGENRMKSVTDHLANGTSQLLATYYYDEIAGRAYGRQARSAA